jgi:predicted nucleic acid-binding protein
VSYLLDTNVISELVARQPNPRVVQWLDGLDPNRVYLSVITIGELRQGIERRPQSGRRDALERWLGDDLLRHLALPLRVAIRSRRPWQ